MAFSIVITLPESATPYLDDSIVNNESRRRRLEMFVSDTLAEPLEDWLAPLTIEDVQLIQEDSQ